MRELVVIVLALVALAGIFLAAVFVVLPIALYTLRALVIGAVGLVAYVLEVLIDRLPQALKRYGGRLLLILGACGIIGLVHWLVSQIRR